MQNLLKTDWMEVGDVILRSILSLTTLFFVTKMLGKKQVSQLSLFDYVIGISIGNFAAEMTINTDSQYMNGIISVFIFGLVAYFVSILTMKSMILRRFFMGTPTVLIQDGKILQKNLRKVKFDINDLLEECRENGYFDLSNIEDAIMEADGRLSILPKSDYSPVIRKDMKLKIKQDHLVANVIIDGNLMPNNLKNMGKEEKWFHKKMREMGYSHYQDILLATLDKEDSIHVYERNLDLLPKDVME